MTKKVPSRAAIRMTIAEDIRPEIGGKFTLLGVFPGERFLVGGELAPGAPEGVIFLMPSLVFLFVINAGEGKLKSKLRIIAPDKKTVLLDTDSGVEIKKGRPAVYVGGMRPFTGPAYGVYTAQLQLEKTKFQFPFLVERAPADFKLV